jgi:hypothetical protein
MLAHITVRSVSAGNPDAVASTDEPTVPAAGFSESVPRSDEFTCSGVSDCAAGSGGSTGVPSVIVKGTCHWGRPV